MILRNKKGTALLVSLLIMGVLMAVSLLVSSLVLRENRVVKDLWDSGKAYYAAESGTELALFGVKTELPGWQPNALDGEYRVAAIDDDTVFEYRVDNRCSGFPCFEEDDYDFEVNEDMSEDLAREFYYVLDLNETLSIPLFVVSADGQEVLDVSDFRVQFFSELDVKNDLAVEILDGDINGWDVLRWKILGLEPGDEVTETISDFTAFSDGTNAKKPSWFGSVDCGRPGELDPGVRCLNYQSVRTVGGQGVASGLDISETLTGLCMQTEAREFYNYSGALNDREIEQEDIFDCYSIKTFLQNHTLNYLTLTNFFNPAVLEPGLSPDKKEAVSKLYVRVELFADDQGLGGETVREFAEIESHGYSGDNKQSLSVLLRKDGVMPVFNFSLYSTD